MSRGLNRQGAKLAKDGPGQAPDFVSSGEPSSIWARTASMASFDELARHRRSAGVTPAVVCSARMLGPATILHDDGVLQLARAKDVFVERWVESGGLAQLEVLRSHHLAYLAKGDGAWSVLFVEVRSNTMRVPSEAERALINERHSAMSPKLAAGVMAITSRGFVASVVRGVFGAVTLIKRPPHPYHVCSSASEGWQWLAPRRKVPREELMSGAQMEAWYAELVGRLSDAPAQ